MPGFSMEFPLFLRLPYLGFWAAEIPRARPQQPGAHLQRPRALSVFTLLPTLNELGSGDYTKEGFSKETRAIKQRRKLQNG